MSDEQLKTAGHTPGPWRIGDAGKTVYGPKTNAFPAMVATSPQSFDAIGSEQRKANIRLIAAAPELLKSLETVLEAINAHCSQTGDVIWINPPHQFPGVHESVQERIQSAIAKVTGQPQP